jgi:voltage-gated potassium channel
MAAIFICLGDDKTMDAALKNEGQRPRMRRRSLGNLRRRIYEILERGSVSDHGSLLFDRCIVALIIVNLTAVILESIPTLSVRYQFWFEFVEIGSLVVFTVEYALRLYVASEHTLYRHLPSRTARLKYILSWPGIIDLLAVLPFWFAFFLPTELRVVMVLRMIRFMKITRYSPAMRSLLEVLYNERRALFGCVVIMTGITLIAAAAMHLAEGRVQPDKLGTMPDAMWWAIVTLGTIGYGDVVPMTALGKVIATATIFLGLIMIALPVGIIANAFTEEVHRRDFVVTWGMLARVPLFSGLAANEIADIMRLLRAQQVEAGATFVRRGEPGHSMYFIVAGEVEIDLPQRQVHLGAGHFFGEVAVLRRARRSANVTALVRTSLLVLDSHDLRALMERDKRVAERIREVANSRIGRELASAKGDLITEEIEDVEPHQ